MYSKDSNEMMWDDGSSHQINTEVFKTGKSALIITEDQVKKKDLLTMDFKIHWLNTTLKFIKNRNVYSLEYPEMSLICAQFIESFICHQHNNADLNVEVKHLYTSVQEAVKIFENKYNFALKTVMKTVETVQLTLDKIPRNRNFTNPSSKSPKEPNKVYLKRLSKMDIIIKEKIKIIKAVPMNFVTNSLKKVLDFLEDSFQASFIFKNMTHREWTFVMNIKALVKQRHILMNNIPPVVMDLLQQIDSANMSGFTMVLNENKFDKNRKEKTVTLSKVPNFRTTRKEAHSENLSNCSVQKETRSSSRENFTGSGSTNSRTSHHNIEQRIVSQHKSSISFQSAGSLDSQVDYTLHNGGIQSNIRRTERQLGPMKSKLLKAMSTPLESDKGLRMMLMMGWNGGALGARGEGITEPIIPTLDIVSGAGLGHIEKPNLSKRNNSVSSNDTDLHNSTVSARLGHIEKPNTISKRNNSVSSNDTVLHNSTTSEDGSVEKKKGRDNAVTIRTKILKQIFDFLCSSDMEKIIVFESYVPKQIKRFIKPTFKNFNRRTLVTMMSKEEMNILNSIREKMISNKEIKLEHTLANNGWELHIKKVISESDTQTVKDRLANELKDLNQNDSQSVDRYQTESTQTAKMLSANEFILSMSPKEHYGLYSTKSYKALGFRLMMMEHILDFLRSNDAERICLLSHLAKERHKFLRDLIQSLNERYRDKYITAIEESMIEQIWNASGNCNLSFNYNKKLNQLKLYKHFINTRNVLIKEAEVVISKGLESIKNKHDISMQDTPIQESHLFQLAKRTDNNNECKNKDYEETISVYSDDVELICDDIDVVVITSDDETSEKNMLVAEESKLPEDRLDNVVKENTDNVAKESTVDTVGKYNVNEDSTHIVVTESTDSIARGRTDNIVKDNTDIVIHDNLNNVVKDSIDNFVKDYTDIVMEDNLDKVVKDSTFIVLRESAVSIARHSTDNIVKGNTGIVIEDNLDNVKGSSGSIARDCTDNIVKDNTVIIMEDNLDNVKESTDSIARDSTDNIVKDNTVIILEDNLDNVKASTDSIARHSTNNIVKDNTVIIIEDNLENVKASTDSIARYSTDSIVKDYTDIVIEDNLDNVVRDSTDNVLNDSTHILVNESTDSISRDSTDNVDVKADSDDSTLKTSIIEDFITINNKTELLINKRSRSDSENTEIGCSRKKTKINAFGRYKDISITPNNPEEKITFDSIRTIQHLVSDAIDSSKDNLPLLQCHGINNDSFVYSCYDENSYTWLKNLLSDKYTIVDIHNCLDDRHKLKIKLNSYIEHNAQKILDRIQLYNSGLDTNTWTIVNVSVFDGCTVIDVEVDDDGFSYISKYDFSLFAGIDKAKFSVNWN